MERKTLILLVGPSASGKSSIAAYMSELGLTVAKSYTTRSPRMEGDDEYHFVTPEEFKQLDLCEHTEYAGNYYGTTQDELDNSDIVICDGNGVKSIKKNYKGKKMLFVVRLRIKEETLTARLRARGMSESEIASRKAADIKSLNHLVSDFSVASDNPKYSISAIANTIMDLVCCHEKGNIGKWIVTDPDCVQFIKMMDRNTFQCIQTVQFPDGSVHIAESTINLQEYTAEELQDEIRPYGYKNISAICQCADTDTRRIIAECVFENHALQNLRSEVFASFDEAETWILAYVRNQEKKFPQMQYLYCVSSLRCYENDEIYFGTDNVFLDEDAAKEYIRKDMDETVAEICAEGEDRQEIEVDYDDFSISAHGDKYRWNIAPISLPPALVKDAMGSERV